MPALTKATDIGIGTPPASYAKVARGWWTVSDRYRAGGLMADNTAPVPALLFSKL